MPAIAPVPLAAGHVAPPLAAQVQDVNVSPAGTASVGFTGVSWAVVSATMGCEVLWEKSTVRWAVLSDFGVALLTELIVARSTSLSRMGQRRAGLRRRGAGRSQGEGARRTGCTVKVTVSLSSMALSSTNRDREGLVVIGTARDRQVRCPTERDVFVELPPSAQVAWLTLDNINYCTDA